MKKHIIFISLLALTISALCQNSIYFNKLVFPQHGTNTPSSIIKVDSFYYFFAVNLDTPFYYNDIQGFQIVKLNSNGNIIDKNVWIDSSLNITYGNFYNNGFILNTKKEFLVCGGTLDTNYIKNGVLICIDQNLDTLWTRTYTHPDTLASQQPGADVFNALTAIRQTYDGGYIITGNYNKNCVPGDNSSYLMKVDSLGDLIWTSMFNHNTSVFDVELSTDSGYIFPAVLYNALRLVKVNKNGILQWSVIVNSQSYPSNPMDLVIIGTNAYVSSSYTYDPGPYLQGIVLSKIDLVTHTKIWEKTYRPFNSFEDFSLHPSMGLDVLPNGNLIISGNSRVYKPEYGAIAYKGMLMKLDSDGDSLWARWYGYGQFTDACQFNDLVLTDDGGFLAAGWQWHPTSGIYYQNAWIVKMDSMGCDVLGCHIGDAIQNSNGSMSNTIKLFPNPATTHITLDLGAQNQQIETLNIFTITGQKAICLTQLNSSKPIDIQNLKPGIYLLEGILESGERFVGKFAKE